MTLPNTPNVQRHAGNDTTGPWSYPFYYADENDIEFRYRLADGTEGVFDPATDYTRVSGGPGDPMGSTYQTTNPVATGVSLAIQAKTPAQQTTTPDQIARFRAQGFEASLDRLALTSRRHEDDIGRALKTSPIEPVGIKEIRSFLPGYTLSVESVTANAQGGEDVIIKANTFDAADIAGAGDAAQAAIDAANAASNSADEAAASAASINPANFPTRDGVQGMLAPLGGTGNDAVADQDFTTLVQARALVSGSAIADPYDPIIDGAFDVWQEGTTHNTNGYGSATMWRIDQVNTPITMTQHIPALGSVPGDTSFMAQLAFTAGSAAGDFANFNQPLPDITIWSGQEITLSFLAEADAPVDLSFEIVRNYGSGGSASEFIGGNKFSITTTLTEFEHVINVPDLTAKNIGTGPKFSFVFWVSAGSSFDARTNTLGHQTGTIRITQISTKKGNRAGSDNKFFKKSFDDTFWDTLPFFQTSYEYGTTPGTATNTGMCRFGATKANSANNFYPLDFYRRMSKVPNIALYSTATGASGVIYRDSAAPAIDIAASANFVSTKRATVQPTTGSDVVNVGDAFRFHWAADARL